MTKEEIIKLLGVLQDTYGKRFPDPAGTVEAWSLVLGAYDAEDIFKAARFYMETKTIKNFPSPADLIDLIPKANIAYSYREGENGPPRLEAQRAKVTPISEEVWMRYTDALIQFVTFDNDEDLNRLVEEHPEIKDHINIISGGLPYET